MAEDEVERHLGDGTLNAVTRKGRWVHRPSSPNSEFVQRLLAVLQGANCRWAPEPGGLPAEDHERVSFIEGLADWELREAGGDPYAQFAAKRVFRWVRLLHDVTSQTRIGLVCHGDIGPHNVLFETEGKPVGLIDWDFAHIGVREDDLATAIKNFVPLGSGNPDEQVARAMAMLDAYGTDLVDRDVLITLIPKAFDDDINFCMEQAESGNEFYVDWVATGGADELRARRDRTLELLPKL